MSDYLDKSSSIDFTSRILPHWHQDGKLQFVTFHLFDSIPHDALQSIAFERNIWFSKHSETLTAGDIREYNKLFANRVEDWLDKGYGSCVLRDISNAQIVEQALKFYDGEYYLLHAYVIMPNHVHILLKLLDDIKLSQVCRSLKSYTAKTINKKLGISGQFWHREYWDRIIRNERHYMNVIGYIEENINNGGVLWQLNISPKG